MNPYQPIPAGKYQVRISSVMRSGRVVYTIIEGPFKGKEIYGDILPPTEIEINWDEV